jgi:hypothetical protein
LFDNHSQLQFRKKDCLQCLLKWFSCLYPSLPAAPLALDGDISPMHLYKATAMLMGFSSPVANVHLLAARTEASIAAKKGAHLINATRQQQCRANSTERLAGVAVAERTSAAAYPSPTLSHKLLEKVLCGS